MPIDPTGLVGTRRALSAWLAESQVTTDDMNDVLLASNEACMNAVEHSGAPTDGAIGVTATLDGRQLRVEVQDGGTWSEPVERPDRGHGLGLMERVMDAVNIRRAADGTLVTLEKMVAMHEAAQPEPTVAQGGPPAVSVS